MSLHAINTKFLAPSEYAGLSLIGLVAHEGKLIGITATKLVEFTGTDDDGTDIDSYVQTGKVSFGFDEVRYARAYVKDQYANDLLLTMLVDEVDAEGTAQESSYSFSVPSSVGARQHPRAVRLRRDVKGTAVSWKIANVSGGGMNLRGLAVQPEGIEVDV